MHKLHAPNTLCAQNDPINWKTKIIYSNFMLSELEKNIVGVMVIININFGNA